MCLHAVLVHGPRARPGGLEQSLDLVFAFAVSVVDYSSLAP